MRQQTELYDIEVDQRGIWLIRVNGASRIISKRVPFNRVYRPPELRRHFKKYGYGIWMRVKRMICRGSAEYFLQEMEL